MTMIYKSLDKGVTFSTTITPGANAIHTKRTFGTYLANKTIGSPDPYVYEVEIPGMDGKLDLTNNLFSGQRFKNRKIQIELLAIDVDRNWAFIYSDIAEKLHGKKMYVCFDEDKNYSYYGRVTINKFKTARHKGIITLDIDADPYKYSNEDIYDDWKWSPFSFIDGVIENRSFEIYGTENVRIAGSSKRAKISWKVSGSTSATIKIGNSQFSVQNDDKWHESLLYISNDVTATITANGTVRYAIRRGIL